MKEVSIRELRNNLSQIVEETAIAKKRFTVTKFGKPKAVLVPLKHVLATKAKDVDLTKLPAFGMWKDRTDISDTVQWSRNLREKASLRSDQ